MNNLTQRLIDRINKQRELERLKETQSQSITNNVNIDSNSLVKENEVVPTREQALEPVVNNQPQSQALILDPSQERALKALTTEKYACLIGQAGTGKTTVTLRMMQQYELANKHNGAFVSYTGRAVQMLKRSLPQDKHCMCKTIHSLLEYMPVYEEEIDEETGSLVKRRRFVPRRTEMRPLELEWIVIDEAGMTPVDLWNNLIKALPNDCQIRLIGDVNQLPPAFGSSVLAWAMTKWSTSTLTTIHRQALDSRIIQCATSVLNGNMPKPIGEDENSIRLFKLPDNPVMAQRHIQVAIAKLYDEQLFDPHKDIVICPTNEGASGQTPLNDWACHKFNRQDSRTVIKTGVSTLFLAVGDKVMALKNDHEIGVTNGMIGYITKIERNGHALVIDSTELQNLNFDAIEFNTQDQGVQDEFYKRACSHNTHVEFTVESKNEDGSSHYSKSEAIYSTVGDYNSLSHGYACTCHKSQGGEYRNVIIVCHSSGGTLLNREWLYTAITRAKERVWILFDNRGLQRAVNSQRLKGLTIEEKIQSFIKAQRLNQSQELPLLLADDMIEERQAEIEEQEVIEEVTGVLNHYCTVEPAVEPTTELKPMSLIEKIRQQRKLNNDS